MKLGQSHPVSTWEEAARWRDELDRAGKKVVFTNGCFDLLHVGHVRYLQEARALGDALLLALNSDASVSELKGPGRPVNNELDRAEILLALSCVDCVTVFSEPRATAVINRIRPHIYAKGGDYTLDSLNSEERQALEIVGAQIRLLQLVPGKSTSATLARIAPKAKPRIAVLGSGQGSNFQVLADAILANQLNAEIKLVLSDSPGARILERAQSLGIPTAEVDPGPHPNKLADAAQKEIRDRLVSAGIDLVILAGFMRILRDPVLSDFAGRIINVHPSLLPRHPGREAWKLAHAAGDTETGCTIHHVDGGVDTGAIIHQSKVPILPTDTPDDVRLRIQQEEHRIFPSVVGMFLESLSRDSGPRP